VLEDLKLRKEYDGFLFLAESELRPPMLKSHHHAELELNLVTRGSVTYIVSGKRYIFPKGSMLWIFPAQEHQLIDRTADARYYVAVFKPDLIERACKGELYADLKRQSLDEEGVMSKLLRLETYDLIMRTMDMLMEDSLDREILNREAGYGFQSDFRFEHGDPDALNAGLRYLLVQCWKSFTTGRESADPVQLHPSIRKALTLLSDESGSLGLGAVARSCGLSDTYLSRLFKEQVGVPINQYRNAIRLRAFMEAYTRPRKSTILECVYAAGFGSYAQFYKVFRRHYGEGPREFLARGTR
jgi:AraC-like DNA-binding protein